MGQQDSHRHGTEKSGDTLPHIFLSEADAEREMLYERWRQGREAAAFERMKQLQILNEAVAGGDENALRTLRETSAMPRIIQLERWRLQSINHLEALIYGVCDAHASFNSSLWRGELAPRSMRLATHEEADVYCPDSKGVNAEPVAPKKRHTDIALGNGERLVAEDAESQAALDFVSHYVESEEDAPSAMVDFHRELRVRENYTERNEHALEAAFTMYGIAKDFSQVLLSAENTTDVKQREALSDQADELLMEFNLQRYGLLALLKTSHWKRADHHAKEDREFVNQLSRDLLIHSLAEQSYALPTANELHSKEYQGDNYPTVETYFRTAYAHMERVLGIRPHRDRVTEVPAIDESAIDCPQGRVH